MLCALLALAVLAHPASGQEAKPTANAGSGGAPPVPPTQTQKNIEVYLRNLYAFGSDVKVVVGPLKETPIAGLLETNIDVTVLATMLVAVCDQSAGTSTTC